MSDVTVFKINPNTINGIYFNQRVKTKFFSEEEFQFCLDPPKSLRQSWDRFFALAISFCNENIRFFKFNFYYFRILRRKPTNESTAVVLGEIINQSRLTKPGRELRK